MENLQEKIAVHERLAVIETKLDKVLEQVTITNGRVSKLEIWKANITGKVAGIALVVSAISAVIGWIFFK
jgi:hypothetical protein